MNYRDVFKRYEIKYLITDSQREEIDRALAENAVHDQFGVTSVRNIYYDTPDFRLIRRSLEKPVYKEKLRVRAYGSPKKDGEVFVELKKKYKSVTYKRRIKTTDDIASRWICDKNPPFGSQIAREINYALNYYGSLSPAVQISYDREAFVGVRERDFRITFDKNILWRAEDLSLSGGVYGKAILPEGYTLMELKTPAAFPLWFTEILTKCKLYSTHFSKYGNAYLALSGEYKPEFEADIAKGKVICPASKGEIIYA
ncbi:MAG: polyphosphate polymerase domain-containing protein [Clostridia bacterium]|nr:polyphosphate polymerase domain-containing protein [Clostridia bacterium]